MLLEKYIGRQIQTIDITENQDVDLTDVISVKAVLVTNTPVTVDTDRLLEVDDVYCDHSQWPYVKGSFLPVVFDQSATSKILRVKLIKLVVNPQYCE